MARDEHLVLARLEREITLSLALCEQRAACAELSAYLDATWAEADRVSALRCCVRGGR